MISSLNNVAGDYETLTIVPDSDTQDIAVIVDGDYSSVYIDTLSTASVITFDFNEIAGVDIDYICFGGTNIALKDSVDIKLTDVNDDEVNINLTLAQIETRTIFITESLAAVKQVEITVTGTGQLRMSEIAMGKTFEIPNNGEQSGYFRPWAVPNLRTRSGVGLDQSPISTVYDARPIPCELRIPNNLISNYDDFYDWLLFITSNTFYIREDDDIYHSYACWNALPSASAHSQSRSLIVNSITFNAYSKTSGIFFNE